MINIFQAVILGIFEGLTEFLPVSSTGHMIIVSHFLGIVGENAATFEVFIQLGAILAVVFLYKDRFWSFMFLKKEQGVFGINGLFLLSLTTLPALVFGALLHSYIKRNLFNVTTVALGLGVGGLIMILIEWRAKKNASVFREGIDNMTWKDALGIGFFQCLALWPGMSRSGSTIVGGMLLGINRKTAAEYSFLAAVPLMCAAVIFDLIKSWRFLAASDAPIFLVGFGVAFFVAIAAIRYFIRLLGQITLMPFGLYRIAVAIFILWTIGEV